MSTSTPATPQTLLSSDGILDTSCLRSLPLSDAPDQDDLTTIITAFASYGLRHTHLLDDLFSTSFSSSSSSSSSSSTSPLISYAFVPGHDSAVLAETPRHLGVLSPAPYDAPGPEPSDEARELAWNVCLSLSNVVLFVARMSDLPRVQASGLDALRASITQLLLLYSDDLVSTSKKALLVIVRDYDSSELAKDAVVSGFLHIVQDVYSSIAKPSPRSPARVSDLFEFDFVLLPSIATGLEYTAAVDTLRDMLVSPATDDYLLEGGAYSVQAAANNNNALVTPAEVTQAVWERMQRDRVQDVPPKQDLVTAFDCDTAMRKVFHKFQASIKRWKRETEGGEMVADFGTRSTTLVKDTLDVYDMDLQPHRKSKSFSRKRDELSNLLNTELYSLFVIQIAKARENTYQSFKDSLSNIGDTEEEEGEGEGIDMKQVERSVKNILKSSIRQFNDICKILLPSFTNWRFDNDIHALNEQMKEDATDKIQRIRLLDYQQGNSRGNRRRAAAIAASAAPKRRQPISLGIHYLDPAPFGFKDSRFEKLGADDTTQYNPQAPTFSKGSRATGGLAVPIAPSKDSGWHRANQDFVFSERK